jgi:hypothetical protein
MISLVVHIEGEDEITFTSTSGTVHKSRVASIGKISEVRGLDRKTLSEDATRAFQALDSGSGKPSSTAENADVTSFAQSCEISLETDSGWIGRRIGGALLVDLLLVFSSESLSDSS